MEMDYYFDPDSDMDDGYDDEWLYVEDYIAPSDVLAENQVPEPGYGGTNYEIALDDYELDVYEYWMDLTYNNDAYWEYGPSDSLRRTKATSSQKRKRRPGQERASLGKRRRADAQTSTSSEVPGTELILFWDLQQRINRFLAQPPMLSKTAPFALLPDWKEHLSDDDLSISANLMPKDMRLAAEGAEPESESESESENELEGFDDEPIDLDPDMLKSILRQRLGEAGLEGMDEGMLLQIISQMLSGEGSAEDATDDLTKDLLSKITGNNQDENLSGWLSQQGVSLQDGDDDSGVDSDALPEQSQPSVLQDTNVQASTTDDMEGAQHLSVAREPSARTNKRKAQSNVEDRNKRTRTASDTTSEEIHRRDSKATQDARNVEHGKANSAGSGHSNAVRNAKNTKGSANGSRLTSGKQPANSRHKRKVEDFDDTETAQAEGKEQKRIKQDDEVPAQPQPEATSVARRTRTAKAKGKSKS